jgi:hypothetical protein
MRDFIFAFTCIFPAAAGAFMYKRVPAANRPFIYTLWLAVLVELVQTCAIVYDIGWLKAANYNLFLLINLALYLWFFRLHNIIKNTTCYILFITAILLHSMELVIAGEWFVIRKTSAFESIVILVYSTNLLTSVILNTRGKLFADLLFIVLLASIITALFDILQTVIVWIPEHSHEIQTLLKSISYNWVNALCYLFIFYGILCLKLKN